MLTKAMAGSLKGDLKWFGDGIKDDRRKFYVLLVDFALAADSLILRQMPKPFGTPEKYVRCVGFRQV